VHVSVDIPDELAKSLGATPAEIEQAIHRSLVRELPTSSAIAREVAEFFGRGPKPEEIIAFRPSSHAVERTSELLEKNREGALTPEERAEIEEICAWNRMFALIKAQARNNLALAA
jgi:hypothetical protein